MFTLNNLIITLFLAVIMAIGQIVLTLASKEIFSLDVISFKLVVGCKWLWLGMIIYVFSFAFWIYILSRFNLKYAYPISATAIFFVAFFQSFIDKSYPPSSYWLGVCLIFLGILVLSINRDNSINIL